MTQVRSYCTQCGPKIEPSSKYCSNCGSPTSLAAAQETTTAVVTPKSRPTGVTIIAILNIIWGVIMLFGGLALAATGAILA